MVNQAVVNGSANRVAMVSGNTLDGPFTVRLYVNCAAHSRGFTLGDPTLTVRKAKTLKGAITSAARMVKA